MLFYAFAYVLIRHVLRHDDYLPYATMPTDTLRCCQERLMPMASLMPRCRVYARHADAIDKYAKHTPLYAKRHTPRRLRALIQR